MLLLLDDEGAHWRLARGERRARVAESEKCRNEDAMLGCGMVVYWKVGSQQRWGNCARQLEA